MEASLPLNSVTGVVLSCPMYSFSVAEAMRPPLYLRLFLPGCSGWLPASWFLLTGVEEEGSGVNACFRSAFVGQGCFRLGFQVSFALLHLGYGVVVTLLCFQLLLAGTAQKAETY